jgi:hypothetical protein
MKMTIKENIESMLGAIAKNDKEAAAEIFHEVLNQKVVERLDAYKVDVANQYFNGFKEGTDDVLNSGDE